MTSRQFGRSSSQISGFIIHEDWYVWPECYSQSQLCSTSTWTWERFEDLKNFKSKVDDEKSSCLELSRSSILLEVETTRLEPKIPQPRLNCLTRAQNNCLFNELLAQDGPDRTDPKSDMDGKPSELDGPQTKPISSTLARRRSAGVQNTSLSLKEQQEMETKQPEFRVPTSTRDKRLILKNFALNFNRNPVNWFQQWVASGREKIYNFDQNIAHLWLIIFYALEWAGPSAIIHMPGGAKLRYSINNPKYLHQHAH